MPKKDPRIDTYIGNAADFAKPILKHIRKLVHHGCPAVEETMKWSFPHFESRGILCGMAAFKAHVALNFWKWPLLFGQENSADSKKAMGQFGRITSLEDLPEDKIMLRYIREAARLNEEGVKPPPREKRSKPPLKIPDYLTAALRGNKKALATFESFSPSHKREYVEWITGARRDETRQRRLATAVNWMAQGKSRDWKYQ
jgi:uncharacterized protein YdeI (YjbR/CyaY-like superfamily)